VAVSGAQAQCTPDWANITPQAGPTPWAMRPLRPAYDSTARRDRAVWGGRRGRPVAERHVALERFEHRRRLGLGQSPITTPQRRSTHAMAYDSARGVACCSAVIPGAISRTTWEFDAAGWTSSSPSAHPAGSFGVAMAYDQSRGRTVAFGGLVPPGTRTRPGMGRGRHGC